ncbi:hypothetical protein BDW62DRAFT_203141 [Aspergillus aurantiobrunneus]
MSERLGLLDTSVPEGVIGMGRTGIVIHQGESAVKLALAWSSPEQTQANICSVREEQDVYRLPRDYDGVVSLFECSEHSKGPRFMENGDLPSYLCHHLPPTRSV